MRKLFRNLILAVVLIALMVPATHFASALELAYPDLTNGLGNFYSWTYRGGISSPTIADYISYFFVLSVAAVGIIALIVIVFSGMQILIYAGKPEAIAAAKERIFGCGLGIALLLVSFILLQSINPELTKQRSVNTPIQTGLYLTGPNTIVGCTNINDPAVGGCKTDENPDGYIYTAAPDSAFDLSIDPVVAADNRYDNLYYYCTGDAAANKKILLWVYNNTNYIIDGAQNGQPNVTTRTMRCGEKQPIKGNGIKSFWWTYQNPGIYYYMTDNCTGISSYVTENDPGQQASGPIPWFAPPGNVLDQTVRSIKVVNDPNQGFNYAFILNHGVNFQGKCSEPVISDRLTSAESCVKLSTIPSQSDVLDGGDPWSIEIFKQQASTDRNKGVTLWSNNYEATLRNFSPDFDYSIGPMWRYDGNLDNFMWTYASVWNSGQEFNPYECAVGDPGVPDPADFLLGDEQTNPFNPAGVRNPEYKGYRSCVNDITGEGNFLMVMYTTNNTTSSTCELFTVPQSGGIQLNKDMSIFKENQVIYRTAIIPIIP